MNPNDSNEGMSREERRRLRDERRANLPAQPGEQYNTLPVWLVGGIAMLIIFGAVLLATNGLVNIGDWWIVFIAIPAVSAVVAAIRRVSASGGLTGGAMASVLGAAALVLTVVALLVDKQVRVLWPAFLIVGVGVAVWMWTHVLRRS